MSATRFMCPRCNTMLQAIPGTAMAQCSKCGTRYRIPGAERTASPAPSQPSGSSPTGIVAGQPAPQAARRGSENLLLAKRPKRRGAPKLLLGGVLVALMVGTGLAVVLIARLGQRTPGSTGNEKNVFISENSPETNPGKRERTSTKSKLLNKEPSKKEPIKEEPVKKEPIKEDIVKKEPVKEDPAKKEPAKKEPIKEPVKEETAKKEPVKKEPVKEDTVKKEPVKEETVKKEPVKKEPVKEDVAKKEPTKTDPANTGTSVLAKAAKEGSQPVLAKVGREIYQVATGQVPGSTVAGSNRIDELVFAKLKEKGITPAVPCSDAVFVRRVYLDVIGTLPTAQETKDFLKDTDPNKRQVLIEKLLGRREYIDFWAMKWSDLLRVKSEFPINLWPNAVRSYHHWIRSSVRDNIPYDQFARTLLTASGSNFRDPPVNFYRAVQGRDPVNLGKTVALTFMGVRPEGLPAERWAGMGIFFSQIAYKATLEWKEQIVFFDPRKPLKAEEAAFPDGTKATIPPDQDPRFVFADWLITPQNPWFTRNIANRVWSWLLGRGIIHEPDDIRPDNPPSNPELLAFLEQELVSARYDLKHLFRIILNSKTYQLSCIPAGESSEAAALFAFYPVRRLEAEVLIDAICQITETTEMYSSPIPEPFTYLPHGHRAISIPDASITSAFLEMFGRPPRDTGMEGERNNNFTAAQRLHMLNSSHIQRKIEQGPGLAGIFKSGKPLPEITEELYLTILSRYPTPDEIAGAADYARGSNPGVDIAWALFNSAEFLCKH